MIKGIAKVAYHFAKHLTTTNVSGRTVRTYAAPIELEHNVKRISGNAEYAAYGVRVLNMYKAVVANTPENRELFKKFSVAYFDGATPTGELNHGDNANFFVVDAPVYNLSMHVYFERLPTK